MRLLAGLLLLTVLTLAAAPAQPEGSAPAAGHETGKAAESGESHGKGGHGNLEIWKWANFLLLAGVIGYFIGKNAGPFFSARSRKILLDMAEAGEQKREADARAAEVERRLANLQAEIDALRQEAQREQSAAEQQIRQQTAAEIAKIRMQAEQEIESAGKSARLELKRYSAQLAVDLAEQKVRGRMTPEVQDMLLRGFAGGLEPLSPPSRPGKS